MDGPLCLILLVSCFDLVQNHHFFAMLLFAFCTALVALLLLVLSLMLQVTTLLSGVDPAAASAAGKEVKSLKHQVEQQGATVKEVGANDILFGCVRSVTRTCVSFIARNHGQLCGRSVEVYASSTRDMRAQSTWHGAQQVDAVAVDLKWPYSDAAADCYRPSQGPMQPGLSRR